MQTDEEIKQNVEEELDWDPDLDSTDIGVTVKDGVVTLSGYARSYNDKMQAEAAAKRVCGVHGIANDIEVRLPTLSQRPDPEIAHNAVEKIKSQLSSSWEDIKVIVKAGWVMLEGEVDWDYQRCIATNVVRRLRGVKEVNNQIKLRPKVVPKEVKSRIVAALHRSAQVDANRVTVEVNGSNVVLKGTGLSPKLRNSKMLILD